MKTNVIEEKMIYTTHEVAKILHSSPNYIYELIEKGKLKAIKLKSFKIRKSAVEEFLKERCLPASRAGLKDILREMDVPFFDPLLIIEKTNGRMAGDHQWVQMIRRALWK